MKVKQIMTNPVVAVAMDDSLGKVKRIFEDTHFHHLLVVDDEKLMGVISDRDLLKALSPRIGTPAETSADLAILDRRAHQIMTRKLISLDDSASVKDAVDIFNQHSISCIPIVNKDRKPVGIVSWRDIMQELGKVTNNRG
ncbi:CBS domain-containing protein [Oceanicoccus sagamiensis]|uniref:CBS domain-containing protein n=1 Tax=Oceanicoccus sagamiensis TaxID=716816 RepID=A0A1X9N9Q5_9GAMM|nr:CBS domain-containing protein [Oceanicoccus sagamiensis]ARN74376.1 CBS domain-containing protein [Oceanicoccus sagamiensis]